MSASGPSGPLVFLLGLTIEAIFIEHITYDFNLKACGPIFNILLIVTCIFISIVVGIFLGLIWGRISAPSQLKNEPKLSKMMYIFLNFLVRHCGENFMKIRTKIPKLQMHEILHSHFYANFHDFL